MIELQKIDCNCNNCFFLVRNLERFNESLKHHHKWQLDYFNTKKNNLIQRSKDWERIGEYKKAKALVKEAEIMRFQFNKKEAVIQYGFCQWFLKDVSFIPNVLQLHTQDCFLHRKFNKNLI